MQALVRIYNRGGFLTRMQDVEFSVYGQRLPGGPERARAPRAWAATASSTASPRSTRSSTTPGPWRDRLTEDQDLGLRLLAAGWKSHQELRAVVEQQGVPRLRPLLRQRTRWSQGNLQALDLLGAIWRAPFPRPARARRGRSTC